MGYNDSENLDDEQPVTVCSICAQDLKLYDLDFIAHMKP